MKQEILNFKFDNKKDFFVTSKNALAFDLIKRWPHWNNQIFFLYGPSKCGKTSLSKIWQKNSNAYFLTEKKINDIFSGKTDLDSIHDYNWVIDNIDLFIGKKNNDTKVLNLINILQEKKKSYLLMTSRIPPKNLPTKIDDLISRVSVSLVVKVYEPDNLLLAQIIKKYLEEREIQIDKKKLNYLTNRIERSYKFAIRTAKKIDKESMETHSQISLGFLKKILER